MKHIQAVIMGASGYTGAELLRLLLAHPYVRIAALTADSQAGKPLSDVFPHFRGMALPDLVRPEEVEWKGVDVAFLCLPHGASQHVLPTIPDSVTVIDLSADFRLKDADVYAEWYGESHTMPERLADAAYGLPEWNADAIRQARLIACPGCYPTAVQLPLIPLLQEDVIEADNLIVDAKSGVTGAGRSLKQGNLYAEANENLQAYGIGRHRHTPEIEQGLSAAAGRALQISFTPHLIPMNRGILATIYAKLAPGHSLQTAQSVLEEVYRNHRFVTVCQPGEAAPSTGQVRGSNRCVIGVYADRRDGNILLISAIDNLLKGASGQAVQSLNLRFGFDEMAGLAPLSLFP